jgi:hypothetical protein
VNDRVTHRALANTLAAAMLLASRAAAADPSTAASDPTSTTDEARAEDTILVVHVGGGSSRWRSRGAGDHEINVGKLALVPRADAASLLRLAPGVFLTNEAGRGTRIRSSSAASTRGRARISKSPSTVFRSTRSATRTATASPTRTSSSRSSCAACVSSKVRSLRSRVTSRSRARRSTTSVSTSPD